MVFQSLGENQRAKPYLKERVLQKIKGWKSKCLSLAGKEVVIKAIIQAISSFIMSTFKLPSSIIDDIHRLAAHFHSTENKSIHWLAWDKLTWSKSKGGISFKDLSMFKLSLLANQS